MLLLLNNIDKNKRELSFKLYNISNFSISEFKKIGKKYKKFLIGTIEYTPTHIEDFFSVKIIKKHKNKKLEKDFYLIDNFIANQNVIIPYEDLLDNEILNKKILKKYKKISIKEIFSDEKDFVIPAAIADFTLEGIEEPFSMIISIEKKLIE